MAKGTGKQRIETAPYDSSQKDRKIVHGSNISAGLRWWETDKDTHKVLYQYATSLLQEQISIYKRMGQSLRLYGGPELLRNAPAPLIGGISLREGVDSMLRMNVIKAAIDTLTSKIGKNRPQPMFLTEEGRYDQRRRGHKLTRYNRGVMYDNDVHVLGPTMFRSACSMRKGSLKVFAQDGRVKIEHTFPWEVLVDETEAFHHNNRRRYQVKLVPRSKLLQMYPKYKDAIAKAKEGEFQSRGTHPTKVEDQILVVEAWHLPSAKDAKDGRHVICIDGADLMPMKPWTRMRFPFVDYDYTAPMAGFRGPSVTDDLQGLQIDINRTLIEINRAHRMLSKAWLFVPHNSRISPKQITNDIESYEYWGDKTPKVETFQTVTNDKYDHLERLWRKAFEQAGISMMSATSTKPAGLESGVALREYSDVETERFADAGQMYENAHVELANHINEVSEEIALASSDKTLMVRDPGRRALMKIDWRKVRLDQDSYITQVYPVSSLPSRPEGRYEAVLDRVKSGFIDMPTAIRLLNMPDVTAEDNMQLAALENIEWVIEKLLDGDEAPSPDPLQDLEYGITRVRAAYLLAMTDGAPDDVMEGMRRWITDAKDALDTMQPPMPLAQPPQGQPAPQGGAEPGALSAPTGAPPAGAPGPMN